MRQNLAMRLVLPGSKSITNRVFLCAALAKGVSTVHGALLSDDTRVMIAALKKLGVKVRRLPNNIYKIYGQGGAFRRGRIILDLHNAGTATRFLAAAMLLRSDPTVITGNARMQERPIEDLVDALKALGVSVQYLKKIGTPPIEIRGGSRADVSDIHIKGNKSSQYLSALLMIAPLLGQKTIIHIQGELTSKPYISTTLAVMKAFGVSVKNIDFRRFEILPRPYKAIRYTVEGDASAASYFSALSFLHGGRVDFENLNERTSIQGDARFSEALKILKKPAKKRTIDMNAMPDAAMTLAVCAPFVKGQTTITGLHTLKLKETDRLKALRTELKKVGIGARATNQALMVEGGIPGGPTDSIPIETYDDHRMAMAFAVMGTKLPGLVIQNPSCVNKTYPAFWQDLETAYLSPIDLGKKHLVLTGMRGAGKTHYGKKIAKLLKRPFVDLDAEIERIERKNITQIVKEHGWGYFREVEQNVCSTILTWEKYAQKPLVIATGGGVVTNSKCIKPLLKNAVNVFIFADPAVLTERVMKGKNRPPLRPGMNAEDEIRHLWAVRRPLYLKYADYVWDDTSGKVIGKHLKPIFKS